MGKALTEKAAKFPDEDLCAAYVKLVVKAWKLTLGLEWWRRVLFVGSFGTLMATKSSGWKGKGIIALRDLRSTTVPISQPIPVMSRSLLSSFAGSPASCLSPPISLI